MNVIEGLLYFAIASLIIGINILKSYYQYLMFNMFVISFLMPSIIFVGIIMYKVLQLLGIVKKVKGFFIEKQLFRRRLTDTENDIEVEPHRLTHPTQYTSSTTTIIIIMVVTCTRCTTASRFSNLAQC